MSLLKREPPRPVESLDELLALAHAMELEAATRYSELAARMRFHGHGNLADVFEHLAAEERGHLESVKHWSEVECGNPPDPALVRWKLPETFDDEATGITDARLLTAYRLLSMAVRNEERAFAFWTYVVAQAQHEDVRRAAEAMAREELQHVATLRRERRLAYREQRAAGHPRFAQDAATLERKLAGILERTAEEKASERLRRFAAEAREIAADLAQAPIEFPPISAAEAAIPDDGVALAEYLVDRYLEAAEGERDEAALARAQDHAAKAIDRLAWLRTDLPDLLS